jgi:prephenate dehydrogenase
MKRYLPKDVFILGSHPLFGPDSANHSLKGREIIFCPVRIPPSVFRKISSALVKEGIGIHTMKPAEHDRFMASTLFLTQFIGRGLLKLPLPSANHSTQNFAYLAQIISTARNDSQELFMDMYRYNRFTKPLISRVSRDFESLTRHLKGSPSARLKRHPAN